MMAVGDPSEPNQQDERKPGQRDTNSDIGTPHPDDGEVREEAVERHGELRVAAGEAHPPANAKYSVE